MTQYLSVRTGSGFAGVVLVYIAGLVAVTNVVFSAGVAATTHVPGSLARTGTYSVSPAAVAPGIGPLAAGAGDADALGAGVLPAVACPVPAPGDPAGAGVVADPLAPVSIAGLSPADTPTHGAAVRVSGLPRASAHGAPSTDSTRPVRAGARR